MICFRRNRLSDFSDKHGRSNIKGNKKETTSFVVSVVIKFNFSSSITWNKFNKINLQFQSTLRINKNSRCQFREINDCLNWLHLFGWTVLTLMYKDKLRSATILIAFLFTIRIFFLDQWIIYYLHTKIKIIFASQFQNFWWSNFDFFLFSNVFILCYQLM